MMATSKRDSVSRGDDAEEEEPVLAQNIGRMIAEVPKPMKGYKYVHPTTADTLLHIAVMERQKEVFDCLVLISEPHLNQTNNSGETALDLCLKHMLVDRHTYDYFACELLRRGVSGYDPDARDPDETLLHLAIRNKKVRMSKLLMQMGYDVNARNGSGVTPVWMCLDRITSAEDRKEMIMALLYYGADPNLGRSGSGSAYNAFEHAVRLCSYPVQEAFFFLMIDDHTSMDVHIEVLLLLAANGSPLFHNTLKQTETVVFDYTCTDFTKLVFSIDVNYLDLLIQKFPKAMRSLFFTLSPLFSSNQLSHLLDIVSIVQGHFLSWLPENESTALEHLCFLLSHGVQVNGFFLTTIYEQFGFSDLLKFVIYMEIKPGFYREYILRPHLLLLYDVNCDLDQILEARDRHKFISLSTLSDLLYYFCSAELRELCCDDAIPNVAAIRNQPTVPLLVELARNVFRKFFIKTFNINNARQFYTLVDKLRVAPIHKKIITYETKLY